MRKKTKEGRLDRETPLQVTHESGAKDLARLLSMISSKILGIPSGFKKPAEKRQLSLEGSRMTSDLEHFIETWNRAWLEKNVALVEKLMADEYLYIAPNGQLLDWQAILKIIGRQAIN